MKGVWNKALSDSWSNIKFSLWLTGLNKIKVNEEES